VSAMEKQYEEFAYVLDFLQHGKPGFRPTGRAGYRAGALIQCVGEEFFTLLEALVKEELILKPGDRVYVGKASREEVTYIIGRIGYEELTAAAKAELPPTISKVVTNREAWFVNFFNTARAITPRMHALHARALSGRPAHASTSSAAQSPERHPSPRPSPPPPLRSASSGSGRTTSSRSRSIPSAAAAGG